MAEARNARRATSPRPQKASRKRSPANDIPVLEWISAGVGLVLASTAIGLTAWDALFGVEGPPAIEVTVRNITPTPHGYVVEVEAFNRGGAPAAQVQIEGKVSNAAGPETSNFTIDYIAEQSHASGGLIFRRDPRIGDLSLRATGFADAS